MNIDEILPYERNARNNARAVPVVAFPFHACCSMGEISGLILAK